MAKQTINIGTSANDGQGDPLRTAMDKINDNFDEVYTAGPVGTNVKITNNTITATNTNGNLILRGNGLGKIDVGAVGNLKITGGANGYVLITDGTGNLSFDDVGNITFTNLLATTGNITQDLVVGGNLTVNGTTTTINTNNLDVEDKLVTIAYGAANSSVADGAGINIAGANANITYVNATNSFNFNKNAVFTGNIVPSANITYSLGNATNQWKDLYVSNNTIYINNIPLSVTAGNVLTVNGQAVLSNSSNAAISTTGNITANIITATESADLGSLNFYASVISMADDTWDNIFISPNGESYAYLQIPKDSVANVQDVRLHNDIGNVEISTGSGNYNWTFSNNGNFTAPGNITTTGNISGGYILGNGSQLTGLPAQYGNANVVANLAALGSNPISTTGNITGGNISGTFIAPATTANTYILYNDSGVVSGSGVFTFNENGNVVTIGTTGGQLRVADISTPQAGVNLRFIPSSGTTLSYGNLNPQFANTYDLGDSSSRWNNMYANVSNVAGNANSGNVYTTNITLSGTGTAVNASQGNILTNRVTGTHFNFLSGLYTASLTGSGTLTANYTLSLPGNAGSSGQVLTTDGSGTLSWSTPAGTYGNANVVANIAALGSNPISTTGNITGGYILGNGSQLTGLPATYGNANVVANIAALGSNPISTTGNVTAGNFLGSGSNVDIVAGSYDWTFDNAGNLTLPGNTFAVNYANGTAVSLGGSYGNANVVANIAALGSNPISTTGNITGGNINTSGLITATGNITGGNILTGGLISATTHTGTTVSVTGNITGGNLTTVGLITATGNVTGGNVNTGGLITATGNITGGNIVTAGQVSATGNITGGNVVVSGTLSTTGNITTANIIGSSANVTITANAYVTTFDITGLASFPGAVKLAVYANTTVRDSTITSPSPGMMIYVTGTGMQVYGATQWNTITGSGT